MLKTFGFNKAGSTFTDPTDLFASGERGVYLDYTDFANLYQNSAGTTAVTAAGQDVANVTDLTSNSGSTVQATAADTPKASVGGITFTKVAANNLITTMTHAASNLPGTFIFATDEGCGVWQGTLNGKNARWGGVELAMTSSGLMIASLWIDRSLTTQEITDTLDYFVTIGASKNYVSGMQQVYTNADSYNVLGNWDYMVVGSGVTTLDRTFNQMSSAMTSADLTGWDLSGLTAANQLFHLNSGLVTLTGAVAALTTSTTGNWDRAFNGCALNQQSVDDVLAGLDASGINSGTRDVDLDGGTSATPSAAGLVSKANLVGKGWTVVHN